MIKSLGMALLALATGTYALSVHATPGETVYEQQCLACHGVNREGVVGLGVPLVDSQLVRSASREALVEFLKVGRMPNDPESLTNGVMPGFVWMSEEDLRAVAEYLVTD